MGRHNYDPRIHEYPPLHCIPAGVCDYCGKRAIGLHMVGGVDGEGVACLFCKVGHFRHRGLWLATWCHACLGMPGCAYCRGTGVIMSPAEV